MKTIILLLFCIGLSTITFAQTTPTKNPNISIMTADVGKPDSLKRMQFTMKKIQNQTITVQGLNIQIAANKKQMRMLQTQIDSCNAKKLQITNALKP